MPPSPVVGGGIKTCVYSHTYKTKIITVTQNVIVGYDYSGVVHVNVIELKLLNNFSHSVTDSYSLSYVRCGFKTGAQSGGSAITPVEVPAVPDAASVG